MEYVDKVVDNNTILTSITIGAGDRINLSQAPLVKKYTDAAVALGFKIVSLPRIGGMVTADAVRYIPEGIDYDKFLETVAKVVQKIESLGAGMVQIESIGKQCNRNNWQKGLKNALEKDETKLLKQHQNGQTETQLQSL